MIQSGNGGWQTTIADLALILFMVSAAALAQSDDAAAIAAPPPPPPPAIDMQSPLPAMAEPVAIYRAGEGMPPLGEWLAAQAPDSRQQLTIVARYSAGGVDGTSAAAMALAQGAHAAGWQPRIMLEPGQGDDVLAVIGYDSAGDMAR